MTHAIRTIREAKKRIVNAADALANALSDAADALADATGEPTPEDWVTIQLIRGAESPQDAVDYLLSRRQ